MNIHSFLRRQMLPLASIDDELPKSGAIFEVGSGYGSLAAYIAAHGLERTVVGIDLDLKKIKLAKSQFGKLNNLSYIHGDALTFSYKKIDGVVMSDFLHHVDFATQKKIIIKLIRHLKKDGVIIIKEIDKNDGLLMWMSRFWDFISYPDDRIYYRSKKEWTKLLQKFRLHVAIAREVKWFPGSTHLFVCRKV